MLVGGGEILSHVPGMQGHSMSVMWCTHKVPLAFGVVGWNVEVVVTEEIDRRCCLTAGGPEAAQRASFSLMITYTTAYTTAGLDSGSRSRVPGLSYKAR